MNVISSSDFDSEHTAMSARLGIIPEVGTQGTGWIPADQDSNPWLQVKMDAVYYLRAVATQGCGDQLSWITEYCISVPDGTNEFNFYQGTTLNDCKVSNIRRS